MKSASLSAAKTSVHINSVNSVSKHLEAGQVLKLLPRLDGPLVRQAHRQRLGLVHAAMRIEEERIRSDTLRGLLALGANLDAHNTDLDSPLHDAVKRFDLDGIDLLISLGADVNVQNGSGQTPLHITAERGRVRPATRLINAGADLLLQDYAGKTFMDVGDISFIEHIDLLMDVRKTIRILDVKLLTLSLPPETEPQDVGQAADKSLRHSGFDVSDQDDAFACGE